MKIWVVGLALILSSGCGVGCGVGSSRNVRISGSDLQYVKDPRTKLCFAFVGASKDLSLETNGLGLANVPCNKIPAKILE